MRVHVVTAVAAVSVVAAAALFLGLRGDQSELLVIVEPAEGMTVAPGDTVPVRISLARSFKPQRVGVISKVGSLVLEPPALSGTLTIPKDAIGVVKISAVAIDTPIDLQRDGEGRFIVANAEELGEARLSEDEVTIEVRVTARLKELRFVNSMEFAAIMPDGRPNPKQLGVWGIYDDGAKRWLRDSGVPVTYRSSRPEIATIDDRGLVSAHRVGETSITASVDGISASIPLHVHAFDETGALRGSPR